MYREDYISLPLLHPEAASCRWNQHFSGAYHFALTWLLFKYLHNLPSPLGAFEFAPGPISQPLFCIPTHLANPQHCHMDLFTGLPLRLGGSQGRKVRVCFLFLVSISRHLGSHQTDSRCTRFAE